MSAFAPIVLFVYNRPDHTRRTLAALAANPLASESDLIVYADGPKKPEHVSAIEQARAVVRAASGFKSVTMIERGHNLGLANSIMGGVSEVLAARGRAIVVEDDLLVAPGFLSFLNAGLERYEHESSVMQISAYSYPVHDETTPQVFFLPMISCWGWATWASAWARFDPSMAFLTNLDRDAGMRRRFNIDGAYDYYGMACQQRNGKVDSWGVRWQLSLFSHAGLVVYPRETLVSNIGVDASGTHGAGHAWLQRDLKIHDGYAGNLAWPAAISTDTTAMSQVKQLLQANRPGLLRRFIERIRS
jgi:hypothetical protein